MKAKVDGHTNIFKDIDTGVIDCVDGTERARYRIARNQAQSNIDNQQEIKRLGDELAEIKALLHQIVNNNGT